MFSFGICIYIYLYNYACVLFYQYLLYIVSSREGSRKYHFYGMMLPLQCTSTFVLGLAMCKTTAIDIFFASFFFY